jgi:hypothetical protein
VGVAKHYTQLIGEADSGNRVELVISASRSLFLRLGLVTWRCGNSRLSIALQTSFIRKFGHRRRSPTSPESYSYYASNQPKTEGANEFHAELHTIMVFC